MEIDEGINPELLSPWVETDVEYDDFQFAQWENAETAYTLIVEQESGPHDDGVNRYQLILLPPDAVNGATVEDGFVDKERATHEAEALMATGTVMETANE